MKRWNALRCGWHRTTSHSGRYCTKQPVLVEQLDLRHHRRRRRRGARRTRRACRRVHGSCTAPALGVEAAQRRPRDRHAQVGGVGGGPEHERGVVGRATRRRAARPRRRAAPAPATAARRGPAAERPRGPCSHARTARHASSDCAGDGAGRRAHPRHELVGVGRARAARRPGPGARAAAGRSGRPRAAARRARRTACATAPVEPLVGRRPPSVTVASARTMATSRLPPRPSFRSGSSAYATSPATRWRSCTSSSSAGRRFLARSRHSSRCGRPACRRSRGRRRPRARRAGRARPSGRRRRSARAWFGVRTLWSSLKPESQIGYQSRSASAPRSRPRRPSWIRTRSRSLAGHSSRRP